MSLPIPPGPERPAPSGAGREAGDDGSRPRDASDPLAWQRALEQACVAPRPRSGGESASARAAPRARRADSPSRAAAAAREIASMPASRWLATATLPRPGAAALPDATLAPPVSPEPAATVPGGIAQVRTIPGGAARGRAAAVTPASPPEVPPFARAAPVEPAIAGPGEQAAPAPADAAPAADRAAPASGARPPGAPRASVGDDAPLRLHAEWGEGGLRVWVGADRDGATPPPELLAPLLAALRRSAEQRGSRLLTLVWNGETVWDGLAEHGAGAEVPRDGSPIDLPKEVLP